MVDERNARWREELARLAREHDDAPKVARVQSLSYIARELVRMPTLDDAHEVERAHLCKWIVDVAKEMRRGALHSHSWTPTTRTFEKLCSPDEHDDIRRVFEDADRYCVHTHPDDGKRAHTAAVALKDYPGVLYEQAVTEDFVRMVKSIDLAVGLVVRKVLDDVKAGEPSWLTNGAAVVVGLSVFFFALRARAWD